MEDKSYFKQFLEELKKEYWKVESDLMFNGGGTAKIADEFITVIVKVDDKNGVSISFEYDVEMLTKKLIW